MHQPLLPKLAVLLSLAFSIPASRQALRFDTAGQAGDREAHLPAALPQVDLELEKSVDNITPNLGDNVTFTVVLSNQGPDAATGVVVTDRLPGGYTYASSTTSQGAYDSSTGAWDVGSLTAGQSVTLAITAMVNACADLMNRAEVTALNEQDVDSAPNNGVDTDMDGAEVDDPGDEDDGDGQDVFPAGADLELDKTVSSTNPQVGDVVTFRIIVTNQGPADATNVAVEDYLPNGYSGITNISGGGMLNGSTITWSGINLPVGSSISMTFNATIGGLGMDYLNLAQVTASDQCDPDSTPNNGVDTDGDGNVADDPGDEDDGDGVGLYLNFDIYSNATALCPSANGPPGGGSPPCEVVCANTVATYFISYSCPDFEGFDYFIEGGQAVQEGTSQLSINWEQPGQGTVYFYVYACGESYSDILCVEILEDPIASFTTNPTAVNDTITICQGQEILFRNNSQYAESFHWNFGNGASSSNANTSATYHAPGIYTAELTAYNACLCSNTAALTVVVGEGESPLVDCVGTVCENTIGTYTAQASCDTYAWSASSNGTIIDGGSLDDDFITVEWGSGPEGIIGLTVSGCPGLATCLEPSFIRVPILSEDAAIDGPDNVCPGAIGNYGLASYGATTFEWSVSSFGTILSGQGTNEVAVEWFDGFLPGQQQWVAVSFDNCYLGCGGADTLNIDINPEFSINGPIENCQGQSSLYTASSIPGNSPVLCNWVVEGSGGAVLWASAAPASAPAIDWAFPAGAYRLIAEPQDGAAYCMPRDSSTVVVKAQPPAVDSILGERLICPGQLYTYEAQSPLPDARFRWEINDGGNIFVKEGRRINFSFGATPPFELNVVQTDGLGCESGAFHLSLSTIPGLNVSGPADACRESISTFSTDRYAGLDYRWAIFPAGAGTIIGSDSEASVEVLWHYAGPATVEVQGCGQSASLNLRVHPLLEPVVLHPSALCPGETAQVQAGTSFSGYEWLDEAGAPISANPAPALPPGAYRLIATDANGCAGDTTFRINSYPESEISISTPDPTIFCNLPPFTRLYAASTDAGYGYQWYRDGSPVGNGGPWHTASAFGAYRVEITDSNGCTFSSNTILVREDCSGGGPAGDGCPFADNLSFDITPSPSCDLHEYQNTSTGYLPGTIRWNFDDPASGADNLSNLENPSHTFSDPGYYHIVMLADFTDPTDPGATVTCGVFRVDSILLVANFSADNACAGQAIFFTDLSTFLPSSSSTNWSWDFGDPASGAANTDTVPNPMHIYDAPGFYAVSLQVASPESCTARISKVVEVYAPPAVSFDVPAVNCQSTALSFTAGTGPETVGTYWNFGDPGSGEANRSERANAYHRYETPGNYTVTLRAQNIHGCESSFSRLINIEPNEWSGAIDASIPSPLCQGDTAILTAPPGGASWQWSTGATTESIAVQETGIYSLTVSDSRGCTYEPDPITINVLPLPDATIRSVEYDDFGQPADYFYNGYSACFGANIFLEVATGPWWYSYTWSNGASGPEIEFSEDRNTLLPVGAHDIFVTVTNNSTGCQHTEGPFVVEVHPLPDPVQAMANPPGANCEGSPVTFSIVDPDPALTYRWNNGLEGPSVTASQPGVYFATAINPFGCMAQSNRLEIFAGPDIALIPSGCYSRCRPDTLCLPEVAGIASYQWFFNGTPIGSPGSGTPELIANESGAYYVEMANSDGCTLTSDALHLELFDGVGTILGAVFVDVNNNGVVDAADTTYNGAVLELLQNGAVVGSAASGPDGAYAFPNIAADAYTVRLDTNSISPLGLLVSTVDTSFTGCGTAVAINWLLEYCPVIMAVVALSGCESINYAGVPFASDTSFVATYTTASGCDSLEEVNIIILQPSNSSLELSACTGTTVGYNGVQLNPNQVRDFVFANAAGCDSIVSVSVIELLPTDTVIQLAACAGDTANFGGTPIPAGGMLSLTTSNQAGCDSLIRVEVRELEAYQENVELFTCQDSISFAGMTLPAGTTELVFTAQSGCDSVISVQVTRYPDDQTEIILEACPGETASFQGLELASGEEATVALANQYGCDSIVHAVVQALPVPELEARVTSDCPDTVSGSITAMITLETAPPYQFSLDGAAYTDSPLFEALAAGFYTLLARDGKGCTATVEVEVTEQPPLLFELVLDSMACDNPVATLTARILSGDDGSLLYRWEDGSTELSQQVNSAGTYTLQVSNSCQEATEEIRVPPPVPKEGALIYVPNAFSPNGDGNNDRFLPAFASDTEVADYEFKVFSRWGGELFSTQNPSEGWDGAVGGRKLNAGVYAWYIQSRIRACGQEMDCFLKGDVVLMR